MRVCDASTPLSKPEGSGAVGLGLVGVPRIGLWRVPTGPNLLTH
jgi:hypothetical protein